MHGYIYNRQQMTVRKLQQAGWYHETIHRSRRLPWYIRTGIFVRPACASRSIHPFDDPESLSRRDRFDVLDTAVQDPDSHHGEELVQVHVSPGARRIKSAGSRTLCAAFECSYTPPQKAAVTSFPVCVRISDRPPGCWSMKSPTSWMNPETITSGRSPASFWTLLPRRQRVVSFGG